MDILLCGPSVDRSFGFDFFMAAESRFGETNFNFFMVGESRFGETNLDRSIWIHRYEPVAIFRCRLTAHCCNSNCHSFRTIKPVELVEDEEAAELAAHPITIKGSYEEAADCWSKLIITD